MERDCDGALTNPVNIDVSHFHKGYLSLASIKTADMTRATLIPTESNNVRSTIFKD